jgi:16S rRNA (guanine966-N2)-methyltransferase
VRIIAGSLKGRRLVVPPPNDLRVRPTSDRAREALFSILQKWPVGSFLDLCAGTGAVALEAYSRGYEPVVCVEQGEPGWTCLNQNIRNTEVDARRSDLLKLSAEAFLDQSVIFLDPPYELAEKLWDLLFERLRTWVSNDGVLVFETDRRTDLALHEGWTLGETRDYGLARFHFLKPV